MLVVPAAHAVHLLARQIRSSQSVLPEYPGRIWSSSRSTPKRAALASPCPEARQCIVHLSLCLPSVSLTKNQAGWRGLSRTGSPGADARSIHARRSQPFCPASPRPVFQADPFAEDGIGTRPRKVPCERSSRVWCCCPVSPTSWRCAFREERRQPRRSPVGYRRGHDNPGA